MAASIVTIIITSLIGLLVYSITARIKQEIRHSIQKAELRFDSKIDLMASNSVTRAEFLAYQKSHEAWAEQVIQRLEERIKHVEDLMTLTADNNKLLSQLVAYAKQKNLFSADL